MSERQVPFVRLPNWIVDRSMPTLTGAQLKVLLVVVRQTAGWDKDRDWMTQSYLMRATGLASAAVSGAVDVLVLRGLIMVTDADGTSLATASERRRRGRLFFAMGPTMGLPGDLLSEEGSPHSDSPIKVRKSKATTDIPNNKYNGVSESSSLHDSRAWSRLRRGAPVEPLVVHGPSASFVAEAVRKR